MRYYLTVIIILFFLHTNAQAETLFKCGSLSGYSYYFDDVLGVQGFTEDKYSNGDIELQKIGDAYDILWGGKKTDKKIWTMNVHVKEQRGVVLTLEQWDGRETYHFSIQGEEKKLIWTRSLYNAVTAKASLMVADCE